MLIITSNQYLRIGFEKFLQQEVDDIGKGIVFFDGGSKFYLLPSPEFTDYLDSCFFDIFTKGVCFGKEDIKSFDGLIGCLREHERIGTFSKCKWNANELSEQEYVVIKSLCEGKTPFEISNNLNKNIKTISAQKNSALRKLGMRNMQFLYQMFRRWNQALKSTSALPSDQPPVWTNKMSVSSQCIISRS